MILSGFEFIPVPGTASPIRLSVQTIYIYVCMVQVPHKQLLLNNLPTPFFRFMVEDNV